jgi:peptidoglycan/xylan/chitin deacetylase (PgdA/CDA1 family)
MELASLHLPARLRPSFAALETWPLPAEPLAGRTLSVSAADQIALAPREVILTFDDGPTARYTPKILKVLDAFGVKATFMMVGRMAEAHPLSAQAVALDGQTVGTHTYDHPDLARLDPGAALAEVTRGQAAVAAALAPVSARPSPFFRFPYLASTWFLQATLTMDGTIPLGVEIDSDDYFRDSPRQTLARLLARLEKAGRGIVLFHDIHPKTVVVLPLFLEALADRGYHVVQLVDDQPNPFNQPLLTAGN